MTGIIPIVNSKILKVLAFVLILALIPVVTTSNNNLNLNQRFANAQAPSTNAFNFAVAGDWSCGSNAKATLNTIKATTPEAILVPGDLAYGTPACFIDMMSSVKGITHIAIGNHDSAEDGSASDTGKYLSGFGLSKAYYSFDVKNAHFIAIATQEAAGVGSAQYNFVKSDLEAAKAKGTEWIFVFFHKPIYGCACKHPPNEAKMLNVYSPLFDANGVDIVFQAHNHNYQRTFPIKYTPSSPSNPLPVTQDTTNYKKPGAPIYLTVGTGGKSEYSLGTKPAFNVLQFVSFGALNVEINDKVLKASFIENSGAKIRDTFTIDNSGGITPPPPPPPPPITCPTGQHLDPATNVCVPDIEPPPQNVCTTAAVTSVTGSGEYTNVNYTRFYSPEKTIDNIVAPYSMWSQYGQNANLIYDLGTTPKLGLCGFDIGFYKGDGRVYNFTVSVSTIADANFTQVFAGQSSGETDDQQHFDLSHTPAAFNTATRYVRFDFNGSNIGNWTGITEINLIGKQSK